MEEIKYTKEDFETTAVPNDLFEKYRGIFNEEQHKAVIDLIKQTYKAGLDIGRNESPLYAVIPINIMENKDLSANAKLLYGEIMALAKKSGKCYATNEHLADILGLKKASIPNLLRELSGIGLIIVDIQRSQKGTYRNITVSFFNNGGHCSTTMGGIANKQGQKRNRQIEIDKIDNTSNSKELQVDENSELNEDIKNSITYWKAINPLYKDWYGNKTQRGAIERILTDENFDKKQFLFIIQNLKLLQEKDFCPRIDTPYYLLKNWSAVKVFVKKEFLKSKKANEESQKTERFEYAQLFMTRDRTPQEEKRLQELKIKLKK